MNDNGIEGSSAVPELPNKGSSVTILPDGMLQIKFGKWTCPDCGATWSMMFNGKVTEMVKGKQNEKK